MTNKTLIKRLRKCIAEDNAFAAAATCNEAADEIERLQEGFDVMTKLAHTASDDRDEAISLVNTLKADNTRLREALEVIASPDDCSNEQFWMVQRARKALATDKEPERHGLGTYSDGDVALGYRSGRSPDKEQT